MGQLVDGVWQEQPLVSRKTDGKFVRKQSQFRNWITPDGAPGPTGDGGFLPEKERYHLYVSLACPWAHRTLIFRKLKKLEDVISVTVVDWFMGDGGWVFSDRDGASADPILGASNLWEVYVAADPHYNGRVSVPVLWDKKTGTIVSNESSEIIRMFNSAFGEFGGSSLDYYPEALRSEIDSINERVYHTVNNGVYKSGFATSQEAYEEAFGELFDSLDWLDDLLSRRRYLAGDQLTEADWRLFTTLVRFDPVYVGHFKCNLRRIADYPNLSNYLRELYQIDGVAETVDMKHIRNHYYQSHETVNPTRIVPVGPLLDLDAPHNRAELKAA
ncbi:MAG: glutathione S-transferase family protein [Pseudomonadota bacterium]